METLKKYFIGDTWIWRITFFLMIASVWFVLSSSSAFAYDKFGTSTGLIFKHVGMLLCTLVVACLVARIEPKYIAGLSPLALAFSLVLLGLVLVVGSKVNGSSRWLSVGGVSFQPSEIAKIALVIYIAKCLSADTDHPGNSFWRIICVSGATCLLIMLENLSTSLLLSATILFMMIIGRIPIKYWGTMLLFGVVSIGSIILFADRVSGIFPRALTWKARVERFAGVTESDALHGDYQATMAELAVASGGFTGKGPGKSYIKNYLPMAFSDFIFCIIMEETGVIGMILIIGCYFILMWRAIVIARQCDRPFQMYALLGLAFMICLQAIINMFVGVGIMPVTGQTLPLVSMGGSSNIFTGVALGIMLSISFFTAKPEAEKENNNNINNLDYELSEA